uniref:Uncharacterized protein n=1 Tax=Nelumbo nucifera TaxID=4432 RepID=A0A822YUJ5_NELNU|nr:TPA_asm: hypothetical protein HUJ06_005405 [Nelumbo nucifera]
MACVLASLLLFAYLLLLPGLSSSHPLCTDSKAPVTPKTPLAFCPYSGNVCCDSAKDLELQKQFQAMNISDPACSSILKSIVCSVSPNYYAIRLYRLLSFTLGLFGYRKKKKQFILFVFG